VDVDARCIQRHQFAAAQELEVLADTVVWQPIGGGPVLTLSVREIFRNELERDRWQNS
jgi:hypothetical protein